MLDIIFFAIIAAVIGFRLYNTLGRKDFEHENHKNVVTFPKSDKEIETSYVELSPSEDEDLEEKFGKKLAASIREIRRHDPSFAVESFLNGAKRAFEIILKSFSGGDKAALKPLLSKEVYKNFANEIDNREKEGRVEETTLLAIPSSTIKNIVLKKKYVQIAVQIVSEQINIIRDKKGKIIAGDPSHVDTVEEIWTFGRDLSSKNPNWELMETSAV